VEEVARLFRISRSQDGFFLEKHPKLAPVETAADGIFIAGCCQGPKDIPDTVAQASAAAAESLKLIQRGYVEIEPIVAEIDPEMCVGCQTCVGLCPYLAITFDERRQIAVVNEALCKGCGTCQSSCPSGAARLKNFTRKQVLSEIEGLMLEL
jgi:heterodisulfide reductase subunit A